MKPPEVARARGRPIPPMAWVLSGAVAIALIVLTAQTISLHGQNAIFTTEGDSYFFRLTARDPFGTAQGFAAVGRLIEAPYRYGRIGLPLLGWIFALGRPSWVGWSLIGVYIASIAALPGVAAVLLDDLGAPAGAGAVVLFAPGILLNHGHVYSDPLLITLLLLACVFQGRGHTTAALVTLAGAILVKEVAVFALVPWIWAAVAKRDRRGIVVALSAIAPYAIWSVWIRYRLGTFPFLAYTYSRSGALSLPFVGIGQAVSARTPNIGVVMVDVSITVALGVIAAWVARGTLIGALAAVYTVLTICLGKNAVAYLLENARVMAVTQVIAALCIVVAVSAWRRARARSETALSSTGFS